VRAAGIWTLQQLSRADPDREPVVVRVIADFVRSRVGLTDPYATCRGAARPGVDIQAAMTVIAQRDVSRDGSTRIDLRRTKLYDTILQGAYFGYADVRGASLLGARGKPGYDSTTRSDPGEFAHLTIASPTPDCPG
jgi:hypothetical protein